MKLLMITGLGSVKDLVSGKKGAFYNTLEEFHNYWDRIDIISPRIKGSKSGVKNIFDNVYIHISPWPLIFHPFWFLKKGVEIYKEQKFDLMTVQEFPPFYNGIGARMLWEKIKVPYVMEIMHVPGLPKASGFKEALYKNFLKRFIEYDSQKAIRVRVINQKQTPDFLINSGIKQDKLIYIPAFYIDLEIFKPTDAAKEYDLIFVGRLEANKGINLLLETIKLLVTSYRLPIKCLIVGDGSLRDWLQSQIANYQLPVTLFGFAKDSGEISELINKSKILVMPSYNEGGPRVVFEAMACGVPVLATPVGIVPDLLKNGLGGEIIAWEVDDIAQKISGLLSDSGKYAKLSREAVEAVKPFEKKAAIKNYAEQLKNIIQINK